MENRKTLNLNNTQKMATGDKFVFLGFLIIIGWIFVLMGYVSATQVNFYLGAYPTWYESFKTFGLWYSVIAILSIFGSIIVFREITHNREKNILSREFLEVDAYMEKGNVVYDCLISFDLSKIIESKSTEETMLVFENSKPFQDLKKQYEEHKDPSKLCLESNMFYEYMRIKKSIGDENFDPNTKVKAIPKRGERVSSFGIKQGEEIKETFLPASLVDLETNDSSIDESICDEIVDSIERCVEDSFGCEIEDYNESENDDYNENDNSKKSERCLELKDDLNDFMTLLFTKVTHLTEYTLVYIPLIEPVLFKDLEDIPDDLTDEEYDDLIEKYTANEIMVLVPGSIEKAIVFRLTTHYFDSLRQEMTVRLAKSTLKFVRNIFTGLPLFVMTNSNIINDSFFDIDYSQSILTSAERQALTFVMLIALNDTIALKGEIDNERVKNMKLKVENENIQNESKISALKNGLISGEMGTIISLRKELNKRNNNEIKSQNIGIKLYAMALTVGIAIFGYISYVN